MSWVEVPAASGTCGSEYSAPAAAGPHTIALNAALEILVEGYLLHDLESMATEIEPKEIGAVGYPMAMAVLAGSELLGALTSDAAQANRIEHYWTRYMTKVDQKYGDLGEIATVLFRHGIAHSYLSRPGVALVRGNRSLHLRLTRYGVTLDCVQLYEDFRRSYADYAKQFIIDNTHEAQRRLDKLIEHDHLKSRIVEKLPPDRWPLTATTTDPSFAAVICATPIHIPDVALVMEFPPRG